jgi:hypothetical protein
MHGVDIARRSCPPKKDFAMKKIIVAVAMVSILTAGFANARPARPDPDVNADGYISREEAQAQARSAFERMDANKDGKLDKADRDSMREQMKAKREERGEKLGGHGSRGGKGGLAMAEADLNGDGALSAEEFVAQALRYFDAADVDGDGRIEKRDRKN